VDLQLTDEQRMLQETTRKYLADTSPMAAVRDWADSEPAGFGRDWWQRGAALGWTSLLVAEDLGGGSVSGNGLADAALVAEEMGRAVAPGPFLATNVVASALSRLADGRPAPDRRKVIEGLMDGSLVGTWCLGTAAAGVAVGGAVMARPGSNGGLVLEGRSGPVEAGADADLVLVTARLTGGSGDELVQGLVAKGTPGLTTVTGSGIDLVRRYAGLHFDQVRVDAEDVLVADVDRQLQEAVVLQSAEMVGATARVLEFTLEWAADRYSFGRPLASYQALKHRFADMKMWSEAAAATAAAAARAVGAGQPDGRELASVAKAYIADRAPAILQDCVQLHGGIGVTWDHDLHLYLRRVVQDMSQFGTRQEHLERIAVMSGLEVAS
jgi:alkylation response protein AidB-like acyl-CoA dehydrogenase